MSIITMKNKCIQQARQIGVLQVQTNYLIRELYKLKPDHEVFTKNPQLAATLKGVIENEQRRLEQSQKRDGVGTDGKE